MHVSGAEIREHPAKHVIKLKPLGKKRTYEIKTRDMRDFELWRIALVRAVQWRDPREGSHPMPAATAN